MEPSLEFTVPGGVRRALARRVPTAAARGDPEGEAALQGAQGDPWRGAPCPRGLQARADHAAGVGRGASSAARRVGTVLRSR